MSIMTIVIPLKTYKYYIETFIFIVCGLKGKWMVPMWPFLLERFPTSGLLRNF